MWRVFIMRFQAKRVGENSWRIPTRPLSMFLVIPNRPSLASLMVIAVGKLQISLPKILGKNIVDAMLGMGDETEDILEQAVRAGYLTTDAEFLKQEVGSGTACVTALIIDGNLVVSNAGDCRAVISRNGASEALTCDHRAGREDERQRIENLGGIVDLRHGVWRVQGSLAVSRAIGDSHMKEWITAEPDTRKIEITSDCEFLILASDGLWDKVSNQEAVDIARPFCVEKQPNLTPLGGGPIAACKKLVEVAVTRKSQDDVSVMIVQLRHFCKK
jgi:protein phosphatase 1L